MLVNWADEVIWMRDCNGEWERNEAAGRAWPWDKERRVQVTLGGSSIMGVHVLICILTYLAS